MNKDKKIEHLERMIEKLETEKKELKSVIRKAKAEKRKESKKKEDRKITLNEEQRRCLWKLLNGTLIQDS